MLYVSGQCTMLACREHDRAAQITVPFEKGAPPSPLSPVHVTGHRPVHHVSALSNSLTVLWIKPSPDWLKVTQLLTSWLSVKWAIRLLPPGYQNVSHSMNIDPYMETNQHLLSINLHVCCDRSFLVEDENICFPRRHRTQSTHHTKASVTTSLTSPQCGLITNR